MRGSNFFSQLKECQIQMTHHFFLLKVYELGVELKEKIGDERNMPIGNSIV
jgi:hypothetical protein